MTPQARDVVDSLIRERDEQVARSAARSGRPIYESVAATRAFEEGCNATLATLSGDFALVPRSGPGFEEAVERGVSVLLKGYGVSTSRAQEVRADVDVRRILLALLSPERSGE